MVHDSSRILFYIKHFTKLFIINHTHIYVLVLFTKYIYLDILQYAFIFYFYCCLYFK